MTYICFRQVVIYLVMTLGMYSLWVLAPFDCVNRANVVEQASVPIPFSIGKTPFFSETVKQVNAELGGKIHHIAQNIFGI